MMTLSTYHRKGAKPYHGHCIHNDQPPKTHNFTMKGMFAAVVWIALWSLIIAGFIGDDVRGRQRVAAYYQGLHQWTAVQRPGESVGFVECAKCGLDTRYRGMSRNDWEGPCPETKTLKK